MLANITSVENLVRQLKDLEETITEVQTTNKIVSILPSQFQHFRVVWDTYKESEQTMELLTLRLLAEERRMDAVKREIPREPSPSKSAEALAVTNQYRRGSYRGVRHNSNNRFQSHKQQNNWKKSANVFCDFHNSSTHSSEECRNHPQNKKPKSDQHAKISVLKSKEEEEDDHSYHIMEDSTETSEENDDWYADSGATCHMSGNARVFSRLEKDSKSWTVKGVGGKRLYVAGTGDVSFRAFIDNQPYTGMLENVLYVPNLGVNLVSICSATEKDNVQILFSENEVFFSKNGKLSVKGKKASNGLYWTSQQFRNLNTTL